MNSTDTHRQKIKIKSEIRKIAKEMIKEKIDLIEGCRQITSLQYKLDVDDDVFLFFRGIASETEDIPIGQERNTWASESLARLDVEKEKYLLKVKSRILDACEQVLEILS